MKQRGFQIAPIRLPERDFTIERGEFAGEILDFEIGFFEGILAAHPDHVEALMFLGNAYTVRGDHARGLEIDVRLLRLRPRDPIVHYNLACSYSLVGRVDDCLHSLERSVQLGYTDLEHIQRDEDLDNARKHARYARVLEMIRQTQGG